VVDFRAKSGLPKQPTAERGRSKAQQIAIVAVAKK
jgi:hypothetical protein